MSDVKKFEITKEEIVSLVEEASSAKAVELLGAKLKELGLDQPARKFAFKGSIGSKSDEEIAKMDSKAKMASFIKAVYNKDSASLAVFKAMNEGTNSAGGFVVPEEFASEVNRVIEDFGIVAKLARKFPMSTDTLNVPRLSTSVSVYWPGENTAGTASQPVLSSVILSAKTLVGITPMSNELLADANISVVDLLVELFAEAIAGEIDSQGLAGTGSPFTGVLSDTGVTVVQPTTGNSTFTLCSTPANARTLISNVKPWALQGAGYVMHRTVWELFQTKRTGDTTGDYFASSANAVISNNANQNFPSAQAGVLWGYPVFLSDKMPTSTAVSTKYVIFGNLKHIYLGEREGMNVSISQDATVGSDSLFEKNMSAVRVTKRVAVAVGLPTAFAVLKTSAS
jgi:HK97 family phage major capsid protein